MESKKEIINNILFFNCRIDSHDFKKEKDKIEVLKYFFHNFIANINKINGEIENLNNNLTSGYILVNEDNVFTSLKNFINICYKVRIDLIEKYKENIFIQFSFELTGAYQIVIDSKYSFHIGEGVVFCRNCINLLEIFKDGFIFCGERAKEYLVDSKDSNIKTVIVNEKLQNKNIYKVYISS